jgi:hypothetical protein
MYHVVYSNLPRTFGNRLSLSKPQWEFSRLCRGGSKSLTYPAVDAVGLSMKIRIVEQPSTRKELHRWMMMEIKAHQVEVANSSYPSLPSCGGTALGEAFTEWGDA